ncbi:SEL1-like repeat protein [bacterium]|nr:SEL1-like repeat protein [bacterium]MBU1993552.1 SEL1-like repeat protein [bacterium]
MALTTQDGYNLYNERKFKEAFDILFDAAAYENNAEAQYFVGKMYRDGDGVEKSLENALKWWKKARQNGQRDAAFQMSEIQTSTKNMF